MSENRYIPGDHWLLCDQCQRKMRYSESAKRWDGLIVHKNPDEGCWETRHPQDFVRAVRDNFRPPVVRPDNDGVDAGPAINCDNIYQVQITGTPVQVTYIGKGYTLGPAFIEDDHEVIVLCEWIIDES